jgi:FkbH-like protein
MNRLFLDLQWLPRMPRDFSEQLREIQSAHALGLFFQAMASSALDRYHLSLLGKTISTFCAEKADLAPLVPFKLGILSNSTIDLIVAPLVASAARYGIALEIIRSDYDQVAQTALTPDSGLNRSRCDAVLFALDHRALPLELRPGDATQTAASLQRSMAYLRGLREALKATANPICIFQTIPTPVETLFGNLDCALTGTLRSTVNELNRELCQFALGQGEIILDTAALAATIGLSNWHDPQSWNIGRLPFALDAIPIYADHVARILGAIRGKSRKVLILDLDNTIWGGTVGDDGLTGLRMAQGDHRGEAYLSVQRFALNLRSRGVLLAVCSKNFDGNARLPFLKHPDILLRLDHISSFRANWRDKATNVQSIAEELSLSLDSLVVLDDDPVERGLIRSMLPEVAVPELPKDPDYYVQTLSAAGYFETLSLVAEDLNRAKFYHDEIKRSILRDRTGNLDAYLNSLDMVLTFFPFDEVTRPRRLQLINKSNQFNLTNRRYTWAELEEAEGNPRLFTLQVRLMDVFGDAGIISVVICKLDSPSVWSVDTWLMSCRVLGRRIEEKVLAHIVTQARKAGALQIEGVYKPSGRNGLVANHYSMLGFTKLSEHASGETTWRLLVS